MSGGNSLPTSNTCNRQALNLWANDSSSSDSEDDHIKVEANVKKIAPQKQIKKQTPKGRRKETRDGNTEKKVGGQETYFVSIRKDDVKKRKLSQPAVKKKPQLRPPPKVGIKSKPKPVEKVKPAGARLPKSAAAALAMAKRRMQHKAACGSPPKVDSPHKEKKAKKKRKLTDEEEMFGCSDDDSNDGVSPEPFSTSVSSSRNQGGRHYTSAAKNAVNAARARLQQSAESEIPKNGGEKTPRSRSPINAAVPNKKSRDLFPPTNTSLTSGIKRRQQVTKSYPKIEMEQFWRSFRDWDFLRELNEYNKAPSSDQNLNTSGDKKGETPTSASSPDPLPDKYLSHDQYKALWAPLLLDEAKSQTMSELSTTLSQASWLNSTTGLVGGADAPVFVKVNMVHSDKDSYNSECATVQLKGIRSGGGGGGSEGFAQNDTVLLALNLGAIINAVKGKLPSTSSLLFTSTGRLGVLGHVTNRSRTVDGMMVKISRKLWTFGENSEMYLLRLGNNVTAQREFDALCEMDKIPLVSKILANEEKQTKKVDEASSAPTSDPLSNTTRGANSLGIGFRIYAKSKFNTSQLGAISAAAREYGQGGFTLVKGPPGTGKTTTLVALLNALHLRQYQRYYGEVEKIAISESAFTPLEQIAAFSAAANVKPRILVCAPSNAAVDNVILKIMEDRFVDGNGGRYGPSIVRVGVGQSSSVRHVSLKSQMDAIVADGTNPVKLETLIATEKQELLRFQHEIEKLQRRIKAIASASPYSLSSDWEIRIDEGNFEQTGRVVFVNHLTKKVTYELPPPPLPSEDQRPSKEMPHYKSLMDVLVKYVERHNNLSSKLEQHALVKSVSSALVNGQNNQATIQLTQDLETQILDAAHIVLTTLGSSGSRTVRSAAKFEVVVVDEAAQSSEPGSLVALQLGSSHAILVGDPQQLPATIFSVSGRSTKYDRSLFQRLEEAGHEVHMLDTQYRMDPAISSFPRRIFYDGNLLDGPNVKNPEYGGKLTTAITLRFPFFKHFTIFDIDSSEERGGKSLSNSEEALLALNLFCSLNKETGGLSSESRVAVITPYSQQVSLLRRTFAGKLGEKYANFVEISTVDAFQGKEAKVVIFSCVRAAGKGVGIGFLSDVQRMNVALTRAKHFLFVIARCRTISVNPYWRDLVSHARKQAAIIRVPTEKFQRGRVAEKRNRQEFYDVENTGMFPNLAMLPPLRPEEDENTHEPREQQSEGEFSA